MEAQEIVPIETEPAAVPDVPAVHVVPDVPDVPDVPVVTAVPDVPDNVLYEALGAGVAGGTIGDLSLVLDVPVELAVEVGRTTMTIRETLAIAPGSIIALDRMAGEPVDLLVNGRRIARGEVVAVDEEFGLRITEVVAGPRPSDQ